MIRINVAEIKKRLVGSKTFAYELTPDELDITDTDLFNGRANAVRDALMNEYNIPAGHIFIEQDRKLVDSLDPSKNCVVVYIVK